MGGPEDLVPALLKLCQGTHIGRHIAIRRRHNGRRPSHHMIPGEKGLLLPQSEAEVVGGMAGGMHRLQPPARPLDGIPVSQPMIGGEGEVGAGFSCLAIAAMGTEAMGRRARGGLQGGGSRGMVEMGMGDQDMADALPGQAGQQSRHMLRQIGAGIDHRHLAMADDIGTRAEEGEGAGVRGHDPPDREGRPAPAGRNRP